MQAIFSVAAICAAIGIAWWQRRNDRRHEAKRHTAAAFVAATAVLARLGPVIGAAASFYEFTEDLDSVNAANRIVRANSAYTALLLPTEEQLLHLTLALPNVAAGLSLGLGLFQRVVFVLSMQNAHPENLQLVCQQLKEIRDEAQQAEELLQTSSNELRAFVMREGPALMGVASDEDDEPTSLDKRSS